MTLDHRRAAIARALQVSLLMVAAAVVPVAAQSAGKPPSFEPPRVFQGIPLHPYGLTAADFDMDGYPDIAVAIRGALFDGPSIGSVAVFRNLGVDSNGDWIGLDTPQLYFLDLVLSTEATAIAAGQLDPGLDLVGYPDIVVTAADSHEVYFLFNDPNNPGTFLAPQAVPLGEEIRPTGISIGAFGGTGGFLDVVVASGVEDKLVFLDNTDGLRNFAVPINGVVTLGTGVPSRCVVGGEFDVSGLGEADAVTPDWPSVSPCQFPFINDTISLVRNDGAYSFVPTQDTGGCVDYPRSYLSLAKGAFDNPAANDIVAGEECRAYVDVILGDGIGGFAHNCATGRYQVHPSAGLPIEGVAVGQLNGGTKVDIVAVVYGADEVSVLLGKGNGSFKQAAPDSGYLFSVLNAGNPSLGRGPRQVIVADLDQDGFGDIVTSNDGVPNAFSPSLTVLINNMLVSLPPS
jgi:hypothetical protein